MPRNNQPQNDKAWIDMASFRANLKAARESLDAIDETVSRFMEGRSTPLHTQHPPTKRLAFPSYILSNGHIKQFDRANWHGVNVQVAAFAGKMVKEAQKYDVPLYVHSALRTIQEQNVLVAKGRSKVRGKAGFHTRGLAVDIVHSKYHWQMTPDEWKWMGLIGKSVAASMNLKMEWGGDWKWYDPAHWQLETEPRQEPFDYERELLATPRALASLARSYDLGSKRNQAMYLEGGKPTARLQTL